MKIYNKNFMIFFIVLALGIVYTILIIKFPLIDIALSCVVFVVSIIWFIASIVNDDNPSSFRLKTKELKKKK